MEINETDIDGTSGEHHMTQSDRGDKSSEDLRNIQAYRHDDGVFSSSPVDPAAADAGLCCDLFMSEVPFVLEGLSHLIVKSIQRKVRMLRTST